MNHRLATALILLGLSAGSPVRADVFEIGDDGAVLTRAASADVQWIGDDRDAAVASIDAVPDVPAEAVTLLDLPNVPVPYQNALAQAAEQAKLSPKLLAALVWQESRWHPAALSPKGAIGLTQLMPATAHGMAIDPHDVAANLRGGAQYLRQMLDLFDGDVERSLAAYDAGPDRVLRAGGMPAIAETKSYVSAIFDRLASGGSDLTRGSTR